MKGMPQGRRRNEELGKKLVDRTMSRSTGYVKRGADVLITVDACESGIRGQRGKEALGGRGGKGLDRGRGSAARGVLRVQGVPG